MKLKATIVILSSLLLSVWLLGCLDVSSTAPTAPTILSEYRFLNAAGDAGSVSFSLDQGDVVGALGFGESSSHQTFPSGNRLAVLSNGDSLRIAMTAEQRATVVLLPLTTQFGTVRIFLKVIERRIFDLPATTMTVDDVDVPVAAFKVTNASIDTVHFLETIIDTTVSPPDTSFVTRVDTVGLSVDVTISNADTTIAVSGADTDLPDGLEFNGSTDYVAVPPGDYTVEVSEAGVVGVIASTPVSLSAVRQSAVVMGSAAKGTVQVVDFVDN